MRVFSSGSASDGALRAAPSTQHEVYFHSLVLASCKIMKTGELETGLRYREWYLGERYPLLDTPQGEFSSSMSNLAIKFPPRTSPS